MKKQRKAFTLVELIVVITILAILGTIAFVSLQGYSKNARDSVRISDLKNIEKTLEIMVTKTGIVPIPDDKVDITASGTVISYQGYAGASVLQKINVYGGGKDPFDGEYYTYLTSKNLKKYQLMGFLENEGETTLLTTTFAKDYSNRFPIVRGNQLGILLASGSLVPIQKTGNGVDIVNTTSEFKAYLNNSNNEIISGTGVELARIGTKVQNFVSCKSIIDTYGYGISDGVYQINPAGTGSFDVYCDMTTDGGGWTYATMLADKTTRNLFKTSNTDKITSITKDVSTKGQISNIWIDNLNKDIMLKCITERIDDLQKYKTPFIIKNFLKDDIENLETNFKQSSNFSTNILEAHWGGNTFNLKRIYGFSSNDRSFYLIEETLNKHAFSLWGSQHQFVISPSSYQFSPAYTSGGEILSQGLNHNNYCMSAIR